MDSVVGRRGEFSKKGHAGAKQVSLHDPSYVSGTTKNGSLT